MVDRVDHIDLSVNNALS